MKKRFGRSENKACQLSGISRSSYRYEKRTDDAFLRERLETLAQEKRRYGCRRLHILLKREGLIVNHKKTERIYRELGLSIRTKKRKKLVNALRLVLPVPEGPDEIWACDFIHDGLANGRRLRCLTIVDVFTRECLAIEANTSLPGSRVVTVLDRLVDQGRIPEIPVVDNGPEFTGRDLGDWATRHGVKLAFIRPGKPIENAFIESFNGRFRDECLNEHWFIGVEDARRRIEAWRCEYNTERPHSSIDDLTPQEFAERYRPAL
jgi:putative transposase